MPYIYLMKHPFSSNRQHLSCDGCLEVREEIIRTVHTVISTFRWAVLTVLWVGFCHSGLISLCTDLFLFMLSILFFVMVWWTWWEWSLILRILSSFGALTLLVGSLTRKNPSPIWPAVFGGMLNLTQSINHETMYHFCSVFIGHCFYLHMLERLVTEPLPQ